MEINLLYRSKTGGDQKVLHTVVPVESVHISKEERLHGAPKIIKTKEARNSVIVSPEGVLAIELTKVNAVYIAGVIERGTFEYEDDDQAVFVNQLLEEKASEAKTPQQKAAETKARNKAEKEAKKVAENSEDGSAPATGNVVEI